MSSLEFTACRRERSCSAPLTTVASSTSSITTWFRVETNSRDLSLEDGLEARVRDPLWLLARQWQLGEFTGDDSGSPVQCSWKVESAPLTGFRGGAVGSQVVAIHDSSLPLETQAEREEAVLQLKRSVQLGLYFEQHLTGSIQSAGLPANTLTTVLAWFRENYKILSTPASEEVVDSDGLVYRFAVAGRVTDGMQLYYDKNATKPSYLVGKIPGITSAIADTIASVVQELHSHYDSLYDQPDGSQKPTWDYQNIRYSFAVGSQSSLGSIELDGSGFPGGSLDWYSFDLLAPPEDTFPNAETSTQYHASIPTHVTFKGMPEARWWTFDDRSSDLGQLVANQTDLVKLLVMEFANAYGNDWFQLPVPLPVSTLSRISSLIVTDTFGFTTLIEPANSDSGGSSSAPPWGMFVLSGGGNSRSDLFFLPPVLNNIEESDPIEKVDFVKDDMAAMVWGVERKLFGPLDVGVDGMGSYLLKIGGTARPGPPTPRGADIAYVLQTTVPYNWIPFVPQQWGPGGPLILRRGSMPEHDPTSNRTTWITPQGNILQPTGPASGQPPNAYPLMPQSVNRIGTTVERSFRRARSLDGSTHLWISRRVLAGHGPGSSGLAFDEIVPTPGSAISSSSTKGGPSSGG